MPASQPLQVTEVLDLVGGQNNLTNYLPDAGHQSVITQARAKGGNSDVISKKKHSNNSASEDLRGIDVSHYQGVVDWRQVSDTYHFAFIKATEGNRYQDPAFTRNHKSLVNTSLAVGAYHFFTPDKDAAVQASHFLDTIRGYAFSLPPVLDVEVSPAGDTESFLNAVEQWLNAVKSDTGCRPIIYSNKSFWDRYLKDRFADYTLWISDYTTDSRKVSEVTWSFWQFSDRGSVKGVSGPVDESRYRGDMATLKNLGSCEVSIL